MSGPALAHPEAPSEVLAERSGRQSLHRIMLPLRVFELARPEKRETEFPADGIGGPVLDRREGMEKSVLPLRLRASDRLERCRSCDSPSLKGGWHRPTDLVNLLALPVAPPESDVADSFAVASSTILNCPESGSS
jgi:hypothetical protein